MMSIAMALALAIDNLGAMLDHPGKWILKMGLCVGITLSNVSVASSDAWDLDILAAELSERRSASARFTETKYMDILETPLTLKGTLHYRAPNYVSKEVTQPHRESFEVDGDSLLYQNKDGQKRLSLHEHPLIRTFAEAFRSTLAGDFTTLKQHYDLSLTGQRHNWVLHLRPRKLGTRSVIEQVILRGSRADLEEIQVLEGDGTRSVMEIHKNEQ